MSRQGYGLGNCPEERRQCISSDKDCSEDQVLFEPSLGKDALVETQWRESDSCDGEDVESLAAMPIYHGTINRARTWVFTMASPYTSVTSLACLPNPQRVLRQKMATKALDVALMCTSA